MMIATQAHFLKPADRDAVHVQAFCALISPQHEPVAVEVEPAPDARASMCFSNVGTICASTGGKAEFGWLIWEWPATYLEAEHHAVWTKGGRRVDVTPHLNGCPRVLFLPDPQRVFDPRTRQRRDNIRLALRNDRTVRRYLALAAERVALEEEHTQGTEIALPETAALRMLAIQGEMMALERSLVRWSLGRIRRNETCWCGSGRKFKLCCVAVQGF